LFDQLSSGDGLLALQVFGPITVVLSVLGVCAAALDLKPLLLLVRNTHTQTNVHAQRGGAKLSSSPPVLRADLRGVRGSDGGRRPAGSGPGSGTACGPLLPPSGGCGQHTL